MDTTTTKDKKNGAGPAPGALIEAPPTEHLEQLDPDRVQADPDQPRDHFDEAKLAELEGSAKVRGIAVPVKVHPAPAGSKVPHQLVYGERRWRVAKKLKIQLPAIVLSRRLTDKEVAEEQLIENMHRADLEPLEEAEHFHRMISKHGHTPETIGQKINQSPAYVRARLKLRELSVPGKKALREGRLPKSFALAIVERVHSPKLQDEAVADYLAGKKRWDGLAQKELSDQYTHREFLQHLAQKFTTELAKAPFDTQDPQLVVAAGACGACPKRTGNQPELFADVKSPDVCTDTVCFGKKKDAAWDQAAAAATRDGKKVLDDKASLRLFAGGTNVVSGASHVDLKGDLPWELKQESGGKSTWGQLAGKDLPAPVVVRDGIGAARELYDWQTIVALAKKAGKLQKKPARDTTRSGSSTGSSSSAGSKRQAAAVDAKRKTARAALGKIAEKAAKQDGGLSFWRWLATAVVLGGSMDAHHHVTHRREIAKEKGAGGLRAPKEDALLKLVARTLDVGELRGLVAELLAAEDCAPVHSSAGPRFSEACSFFNIDLKKLAAAVVLEQKAAAAPKPKKRPGRGKS